MSDTLDRTRRSTRTSGRSPLPRITRPRTGIRVPSRDAVNIFGENDRVVANLLDVWIFDSAADPNGPLTRDTARAWMAQRLGRSPIFRRKLRRLAGDVGNPYWVSDPDPSMAEHVFVTAIDQPGWTFVEAEVTRLMNEPMTLTESIWEVHVLTGLRGIDGLPDGACAVVTKVHHSVVDGIGLVDTLRALFSDDPDASATVRGNHDVVAIARWPREVLRLPRACATFFREFSAFTKVGNSHRAHTTPRPALRFNRRVRLDQWVRVEWFTVSRARSIRVLVPGSTINDVMLTVVSLALSRFLDRHHEHPVATLSTTVPFDIHTIRDNGAANQTTFFDVDLHTDICDPVARLHAIHRSAQTAKATAQHVEALDRPRPFEVIPPLVMKGSSVASRFMRHTGPVVASNTVVSNMPHGAADLRLRDAPAVAVFMPMPTAPGMGLIHHIGSLGDSLSLTVTVEKHMMADPHEYMALLRGEFENLESLAASVPID